MSNPADRPTIEPRNTFLPHYAPEWVVQWMQENNLVAISRGAYDFIRGAEAAQGAAPGDEPCKVCEGWGAYCDAHKPERAAPRAEGPPHHPNVPGKQHVLPKPTQPRPKPAPPPPGAASPAALDDATRLRGWIANHRTVCPVMQESARQMHAEFLNDEYARLSRPSEERVPHE